MEARRDVYGKHHVMCIQKEMDFHPGSTISKITYPLKIIYSVQARIHNTVDFIRVLLMFASLNNFNYQLTSIDYIGNCTMEKKKRKNVKLLYMAHDYQLTGSSMLKKKKRKPICESTYKWTF